MGIHELMFPEAFRSQQTEGVYNYVWLFNIKQVPCAASQFRKVSENYMTR